MMNWWYYAGAPMAGIGIVFMVLWWFLIAMLIVAIVRWLRFGPDHRDWHHHRHGDPALDLLRERFAKGEIDEKEFEKRRKMLEGE
jgi:putative membrane protein